MIAPTLKGMNCAKIFVDTMSGTTVNKSKTKRLVTLATASIFDPTNLPRCLALGGTTRNRRRKNRYSSITKCVTDDARAVTR